jgi:hypothetical protein
VAEGWISAAADLVLTNEAKDYAWVKLHTGPPGAAATSAAATETDRVQVTFGTASGGTMTTTTDAEWTSVADTEDYTHFSMWTLVTSGLPGYTGTITANPVTAGDTFTIQAGDLDISVPVAS